MNLAKVLSNIDSYDKALKFCNMVIHIHNYCNGMKDTDPYFWMESNRDCFGKIEDTAFYSTDSSDLVYKLNHSTMCHEPTCISTDFAFVCYSPDLGIDVSTGNIPSIGVPVIESEDSWFQYSTVYTKEELVSIVFHNVMLAGYWEAMYLDTNFLARFGLAMQVDLNEFL